MTTSRPLTGEDGIARFKIPASGIPVLTATKGDDIVILPRSESYWGEDTWSPQYIPGCPPLVRF